jgi:hypothetical protein
MPSTTQRRDRELLGSGYCCDICTALNCGKVFHSGHTRVPRVVSVSVRGSLVSPAIVSPSGGEVESEKRIGWRPSSPLFSPSGINSPHTYGIFLSLP